MCSLSERPHAKAEPPSPPRIRRLWLNSWGGELKRNPTPGMGRHVLNSSTTAACQFCSLFWAESPIPLLSDPRDDHAFARALLLAGLELPCDAARLLFRSSTKRGERRGGIASGPAVATDLLLVGDAPGAALPPSAHLCRGLPRPTWASPPGHEPRTSVRMGYKITIRYWSEPKRQKKTRKKTQRKMGMLKKGSLKKTLVHFAVTKIPHFHFA